MKGGFSEANWKELRRRLQSEYGWLTDDELDLIEGEWEALVIQLQEHYGYTREQAEEEAERYLLERQL